VLNKSKILPLHDHLFDDDALIFKNLNSRRVSLVSKKSGRILSMDYNGFPYLGIWAKPGASFVCIEPWQGIADSADSTQELTEKEGIISLDAGEGHQADYSITFHK
jgi:galactose mutarotase-like enzyme